MKEEKETFNITEDVLIKKIMTLSNTIWENNARKNSLHSWLNNFNDAAEKLHALFLLSEFMYFGDRQIREGLKSLYRDIFKYPIIESIRKQNSDTVDRNIINNKFQKELLATRFIGLGSPADSGTYLLYLFRQENNLATYQFITSQDIFTLDTKTGRTILSDHNIKRYIFLDDLCGSGQQCMEFIEDPNYPEDIITTIRRLKKEIKEDVIIDYYSLFLSNDGKKLLEKSKKFNNVKSVFELDESYRTFSNESLVFKKCPNNISVSFTKAVCAGHGEKLNPSHPLGHDNSQLLIGFNHNTPDNCLPVIWSEGNVAINWFPIFKRYHKKY